MNKQKDGRYRSKVVVGSRADGRNIVKWIQGTTKKELEANRQRILAEYRDGIAAEASSVLALEWIYKWYDTAAAPGMKEHVSVQKRRRIDVYIVPVLRDKQLRAVSAFDLQAIMNSCDKGHTVTVQLASIIRGAFRSAYAQGIIPRDVSTSLVVRPRAYSSRRALTVEETANLERGLSERTTARLMAAMFYYTGMRRGEVLGLQWRDVDLKAKVIRVKRSLDFRTMTTGTLKTPAAEREIPICPELEAILKENPGIGETFVVHAPRNGGSLSESTFKLWWGEIQEMIGSKEITPHYLRHNYATRLYDAGVDVLTAAKVLGHADPTTTLKIYTDIDNSRRVKEGAKQVQKAFGKSCLEIKVAKKLPEGEEGTQLRAKEKPQNPNDFKAF